VEDSFRDDIIQCRRSLRTSRDRVALIGIIAYNAIMAVLNIRSLPEKVHARLRIKAAKSGRSMEAEAREILANACKTETSTLAAADLQRLVDELYAKRKRPKSVVDEFLADRRRDEE
jgi:plasmid stability protein